MNINQEKREAFFKMMEEHSNLIRKTISIKKRTQRRRNEKWKNWIRRFRKYNKNFYGNNIIIRKGTIR